MRDRFVFRHRTSQISWQSMFTTRLLSELRPCLLVEHIRVVTFLQMIRCGGSSSFTRLRTSCRWRWCFSCVYFVFFWCGFSGNVIWMVPFDVRPPLLNLCSRARVSASWFENLSTHVGLFSAYDRRWYRCCYSCLSVSLLCSSSDSFGVDVFG